MGFPKNLEGRKMTGSCVKPNNRVEYRPVNLQRQKECAGNTKKIWNEETGHKAREAGHKGEIEEDCSSLWTCRRQICI